MIFLIPVIIWGVLIFHLPFPSIFIPVNDDNNFSVIFDRFIYLLIHVGYFNKNVSVCNFYFTVICGIFYWPLGFILFPLFSFKKFFNIVSMMCIDGIVMCPFLCEYKSLFLFGLIHD